MEQAKLKKLEPVARARCAGCGKGDTPRSPLPYEMQHENYAPDLYCEKCYQNHKMFYEEAEDNILRALKGYWLHDAYSLKHLQAALESLGGVTEEAFAEYLERGTVSFFQPRSALPTD